MHTIPRATFFEGRCPFRRSEVGQKIPRSPHPFRWWCCRSAGRGLSSKDGCAVPGRDPLLHLPFCQRAEPSAGHAASHPTQEPQLDCRGRVPPLAVGGAFLGPSPGSSPSSSPCRRSILSLLPAQTLLLPQTPSAGRRSLGALGRRGLPPSLTWVPGCVQRGFLEVLAARKPVL